MYVRWLRLAGCRGYFHKLEDQHARPLNLPGSLMASCNDELLDNGANIYSASVFTVRFHFPCISPEAHYRVGLCGDSGVRQT